MAPIELLYFSDSEIRKYEIDLATKNRILSRIINLIKRGEVLLEINQEIENAKQEWENVRFLPHKIERDINLLFKIIVSYVEKITDDDPKFRYSYFLDELNANYRYGKVNDRQYILFIHFLQDGKSFILEETPSFCIQENWFKNDTLFYRSCKELLIKMKQDYIQYVYIYQNIISKFSILENVASLVFRFESINLEETLIFLRLKQYEHDHFFNCITGYGFIPITNTRGIGDRGCVLFNSMEIGENGRPVFVGYMQKHNYIGQIFKNAKDGFGVYRYFLSFQQWVTITEQTAPVNSEQTAPVISLQTAPLKNMFLG